MTVPHASFAALAELAPIGRTTRTWEACRLVYVDGKSQTEAAAATDLHIATVSNAVAKCEATYYRLPALLATVRLAMGASDQTHQPRPKEKKPENYTPRSVLAAQARARGDKTFTDPNPCKRGHDAPFYASGGGVCTKCVEEANWRTSDARAKFLERLARSEV